jgi:putative MATE family efflux protein
MHRRLLGLALPIILDMVLQMTLGVVDTIFVSWISLAALAGIGTAQQVIGVITAIFLAISVGATVLIANATGAQDAMRIKLIIGQSLWWGSVLALIIGLFTWLGAPWLIGSLGLTHEAAELAIAGLEVTGLGMWLLMAQLLAGALYRGMGDGQTPLRIGVLVNLLNAVLGYILIFGIADWPGLGAIGSVWATLVARACGGILLWRGLWRHMCISFRGDWGMARQLGAIGVPTALEEVLILGAMTLLTPVVAVLGMTEVAAHRVILTILPLAYLPVIGLTIATTALVGQATGARDHGAIPLVLRTALVWGIGWMIGVMTLLLLWPEPVVRLFASEGSVANEMVAQAVPALQWAALCLPWWAACLIIAGGMRGLGHTRVPLLVSASAVWLTLGLAWVFVTSMTPTPAGVWQAHLVLFPIETIVLVAWWRTMTVTPRVASS